MYESRNPTDIIRSYIRDLVDSVSKMRYGKWELILVVSSSQELLRWLRSIEVQGLRVIFTPEAVGLTEARNIGAQSSRGEIIAFIDDDTIVLPGWGDAVVSALGRKDVIGVTGPCVPRFDDVFDVWIPREFSWLVGGTTWADYQDNQEVRNVWGTNMAFSCRAFDQGRGFSTTMGLKQGDRGTWSELGAEEVEFSIRLRQETSLKVIYRRDMQVFHRVSSFRTTNRAIAQRAFWIGRSRRMIQSFTIADDVGLVKLEGRLLRDALKAALSLVSEVIARKKGASRTLQIEILAFLFLAFGFCFQSGLLIRFHI